MNFRMLMKKKTILELYYFYFHFLYMKENQGLKETNKGLDWMVSFIHTCMYFPYNALVVKYFSLFKCCLFYGVHENAYQKIVTFTTR